MQTMKCQFRHAIFIFDFIEQKENNNEMHATAHNEVNQMKNNLLLS